MAEQAKLAASELGKLVSAAVAARGRAYAKYSDFSVGCAILDRHGKVYTGCNVENASFGLTVCAERNAVAQAVLQGERPWRACVIASDQGQPPCGACLQVLAEFCSDLLLFLVAVQRQSQVTEVRLSELLPTKFTWALADEP